MNPPQQSRAGTLLWIGPCDHPEMQEAYRSCQQLAPQFAYRASLDEACQRPAQLVSHLVMARTERTLLPAEHQERLRRAYPDAHFACLLGHACEGEMRTGEPWQGWQRIYWHRWHQEVPEWFAAEPLAGPLLPEAPGPSVFVVVVAATMQQAEPLLEVAGEQRWAASWVTPAKLALVRSASHVVWDDSAAGPTDRQEWRERLSRLPRRKRDDRVEAQTRHAWLTNFPRLHGWREAQAAGVDCLLSKPASLRSLIGFVRCGPSLSSQEA